MIAKKTLFFFAKTVLIGDLLFASTVSYSAEGLEGTLLTKDGRSAHLDRIEEQLNQLQECLNVAFSYTILPQDNRRVTELQDRLQISSRIRRQLSERVTTYRTILNLADTGTSGRRSSTQTILSLTHNNLRLEREIERLRMENAALKQKEPQEVNLISADPACYSMTAWGEKIKSEKKTEVAPDFESISRAELKAKEDREKRMLEEAMRHKENLVAIEKSELEEAIRLSLLSSDMFRDNERSPDELLDYHRDIKEMYEMVEELRHAYDYDGFSSQFPTSYKEKIEKIHHVIRSEFSKKILPFLNEAKESHLLGRSKVCPLYRSYPKFDLKIDEIVTGTLKDDECHLVHEMLEVGNMLDTLYKEMGVINTELFAEEVADFIFCDEEDDEAICLREGFRKDLSNIQSIITKFEKIFGIQIVKEIASNPAQTTANGGTTTTTTTTTTSLGLSNNLPENYNKESAYELM